MVTEKIAQLEAKVRGWTNQGRRIGITSCELEMEKAQAVNERMRFPKR